MKCWIFKLTKSYQSKRQPGHECFPFESSLQVAEAIDGFVFWNARPLNPIVRQKRRKEHNY